MRIARCITALIVCAMAIGTTQAQKSGSKDKTHIIEAFLDNTPAIYGCNLNFNDFFSDSYVTAKVYADDDSIVTKIRIKKCRTLPSGNSDPYSYETAIKLLKESCKSIISSYRWSPGENECRVIWRSRHDRMIEGREKDRELMSFVSGLITDKTKRKLYRDDGSAFIRLQLDSTGRILEAEHIGNIFWGTGNAGWTSSTDDVAVSTVSGYENGDKHYTMKFKPKSQPARYMDKWELRMHHADKLLRKNARQIARELNGRQFSGLAGKGGEICIEIHVDTSDIEIEEIDPAYPGGAKALKEFYIENFKYGRKLRRNRIKGNVNIGLLIKKNGKAKLQYVEMHEPTFSYEGRDSWDDISGEISSEIKRITKKLPRWTPGKHDGKKIEKNCSFRIRLDGNNR